jgi:hypothetical protein
MSPCGTKRQFARCEAMSGVGGKADLPVERPDFSLDPEPTSRGIEKFGHASHPSSSTC